MIVVGAGRPSRTAVKCKPTVLVHLPIAEPSALIPGFVCWLGESSVESGLLFLSAICGRLSDTARSCKGQKAWKASRRSHDCRRNKRTRLDVSWIGSDYYVGTSSWGL
jgi:hypothetical protein